MPRATARRQDASGVKLCRDGTDARDALGVQIIHNATQVGSAAFSAVSLHPHQSLLVVHIGGINQHAGDEILFGIIGTSELVRSLP